MTVACSVPKLLLIKAQNRITLTDEPQRGAWYRGSKIRIFFSAYSIPLSKTYQGTQGPPIQGFNYFALQSKENYIVLSKHDIG